MSARRLTTLVAALSLVIGACGTDGPTEIPPPPPPPPFTPSILFAAANITGLVSDAACGADNDDQTAALIAADAGASVLAVGDMTMTGTLADFQNCYDPSWGQFKARTYPVIGNHEYGDAYNHTNLDSVFAYFGDRIPPSAKPDGYYSFDLGAWHVIVINDNWDKVGGTIDGGPTGAQLAWLQSELAAVQRKCVLAAFHQARFMSSATAGWTERASRRSTWAMLAAAGVDVVINGHDHFYERMKPLMNDGTVDAARGIQQFNVGTGGESLRGSTDLVAINPNSEIRLHNFGVLRMELDSASYKWSFLLDAGGVAADTGSAACH